MMREGLFSFAGCNDGGVTSKRDSNPISILGRYERKISISSWTRVLIFLSCAKAARDSGLLLRA